MVSVEARGERLSRAIVLSTNAGRPYATTADFQAYLRAPPKPFAVFADALLSEQSTAEVTRLAYESFALAGNSEERLAAWLMPAKEYLQVHWEYDEQAMHRSIVALAELAKLMAAETQWVLTAISSDGQLLPELLRDEVPPFSGDTPDTVRQSRQVIPSKRGLGLVARSVRAYLMGASHVISGEVSGDKAEAQRLQDDPAYRKSTLHHSLVSLCASCCCCCTSSLKLLL